MSEQATKADEWGRVLTLAAGSEEAPISADGPERTMSAAESEQATSAAGSDPSAAGSLTESECAALSEQAVMSPADSGQAGMRAAGRTQGPVELALDGPVDRDLLDSLVRDPPRDNLVANKHSLDITIEKITCLRDGEWLNGEVITFWLEWWWHSGATRSELVLRAES